MKYKVTLNGRTYEVEVEAGKAMLLDEYEAIVPTAAPAAPAAAPAPVAAPAAAPAPDVLVVLEAMKMENEILAPKACTVKQVLVSKGATVDTGATLVVLG